MSQTYTPPSTIPGISRLAKSIRQQRGIKHTQALEAAAKVAGFQSFKHAKRVLSASATADTLVPLFLTVFWHDREATPFSGRCTALVHLPQRTVELLPSLKVRGYSILGGFQLESPDHLRGLLDAGSAEQARNRVTDAIRQLVFTDATGLRPARKAADIRRMSFLQNLPGCDHLTLWIDPLTGDGVGLDEPYESRLASRLQDREEWLAIHGLASVAPDWGGLYAPGRTAPYLVSSKEELLQRTVSAVENLGDLPAIDWVSHAGPYHAPFISPHRLASGQRYRHRPQPSFGQKGGAIAYGGRAGVASEWRPAVPMPIADHMTLGSILRGLAWSHVSSRTYAKLTATLSRLDDWSMCEHPNESSQTLSDLYYGSDRQHYNSVAEQRAGLADARRLVTSGYNDCRPRRELLAVLEQVEANVIDLGAVCD